MKFDYAYLENKKSELSVFQIALIYRNIPLFRAEYEPYMVCPICKEAKLTYPQGASRGSECLRLRRLRKSLRS